MMKALLFIVLMTIINAMCFAQAPLVKQWDYRYGSPEVEELYSMKQTADSGFVLIGYIYSIYSGGDVTDTSRGFPDMWVVKIDKFGLKQWDKRYGGTRSDGALDGIQTNDGGYIFVGFSFSNTGGEKSQDNRDTSMLTADLWIVKVNASGIKQWDRRYGGNGSEGANKIIRTNDGNFIIVGTSNSDVSGDVTQPSRGGQDIWLVKIDGAGNKLWDKRYGGSHVEYVADITLFPNDEYLISSASYSPLSGDKTDNNRDASLNSPDYWIIKINSSGNKIWDKTFGGIKDDFAGSVFLVNSNNYLIAGSSRSGISGDRTIANYDTSNSTKDFWLVRVDSSGNKIGEKVFGGTSSDEYSSIIRLQDGNYLISGDSYSQASGDKSENNMGNEQTWLIKTDTNLVKIWDKTIFTSNLFRDDEGGYALQSYDGCLVIKNFNWADIGGYKTQHNWDPNLHFPDYWVVKFCDSTSTTSINLIDTPSYFSISPNPFFEQLYIVSEVNEITEFILYDFTGRKILRHSFTNSTSINTAHLAKGIYFYEVLNRNYLIKKGKVVKN
ncbi:MAG: T9SS type A sorting domain-containing protein [Bacteroidetes bacterium]|nr:T9SS type A sorting domain-containing protein [Bacteroidota bacterium]